MPPASDAGGGRRVGAHRDPGRVIPGGPAVAGLADHGHTAVSDPELPLPDVPLIGEDLLLQAKALADSGAPTEAVEAALEHVAALRGRS